MSEFLQQHSGSSKTPCTNHSGSTRSPELMDYTSDVTLDPDCPVQIRPQYPPNGAQTGCHYVKSTAMQQPGPQDTSAFIVHEVPNPLPINSNQLNQNITLFQQEQLPDIGIWRTGLPAPTAIPQFSGDRYSRSVFTMPDDFIQFLFDGNQPNNSRNGDNLSTGSFPSCINTQSQFSESPNPDIFSESYLPQFPLTIGTASYEINLPSAALSNEKSKEIFNLIRDRLTGNKHTPELNFQNSTLHRDPSQDLNIMSQNMMQEYINSYWMNFHSQLPILHRPTFSPDKTPNLLLVAIMIIGASCSMKSEDHALARSATEFSTILAWYLRWEVFSSMHIQTNNLWVFQTLLLLETYEKTCSSRALHERAHIHHATAITLMRRGSFLVGSSPLDTPPNQEENDPENQTSRSSSDLWWEKWIEREATRRVAFAAFMIDSTHAAMFGHSMIMVTHEMRLVLPCDDALWSATSVDEVRKVETMLRLNGVKPLPFVEGLQRTLNDQEIHTNAFGRSILLCGLLSVSWHMNQREMQISSLDVKSNGADRGTKWRRSITRAFDLWRGTYEHTTQSISNDMSKWTQDADALLGSRSALFHLAQLSVHANILECQITAGANRVLGRIMRKQEVETARRRIRNEWAPTMEARKATFYAIRFLCSVFCKSTESNQVCDHNFITNYATSNTTLPIHRWVLYYAALVVWCYSYVADGPAHVPASLGSTIDDHIQDMQHFLRSTERIKSPEDVAFHRLNGCTGMLKVLCYIFRMASFVFFISELIAGAFSTAALVATFFIVDRKADFNAHVDALVEGEAQIPNYLEKV
ncbi:hypothetical protein V501_04857 [Pseudogymnoascus sp. VKM F-4519 (FW-2642)]|nr:hypothetical protein V501_04857 [Pseudogymnoascus sp. VKM F-4519 (FW-2642)]